MGAGTRGPQSHKSQASRSLMGRLSLRARSVLQTHQYKYALFGADMSSIKFKCNSNSGGEFVGWRACAGPRADRDSQLRRCGAESFPHGDFDDWPL